MAYKKYEQKVGYTEEDNKVDFKNMKWESEYELAMAMRLFLESRMQGRDEMEVALELVEYQIVEEWKDERYREDLSYAASMVDSSALTSCTGEEGIDEEKWNGLVMQNIMLRFKAIKQLFFRRNMSPQLSEQGTIGFVENGTDAA